MTCKFCKADLQPENFAQPRQCAFRSGVFNSDNWMCDLMSQLRYAAIGESEEKLHQTTDGESCLVLPIPEEAETCTGFLVMTMYKRRGCTGQALIMCDDDEPTHLTLSQAEEILSLLKFSHKRNIADSGT